MSKIYPKISIVVPSFNQASFVAETLQSLVDQNYPNLQVVIQDGCSTDGSVNIIGAFTERYPDIFTLHVEKDTGQAQALNRGFARTDGEIMGFLNSDDTLLPGCLARVSREINPRVCRYVVFGRCIFTGYDSPYVGLEHPSSFKDHFDHLAIWKRGFNTIPQPSTFWHRKVWSKCGGFNEKLNGSVDYFLFCKFSRYFHFHKVDELWSTYRMHPASFSGRMTEKDYLDLSIGLSRLYWGSWFHPRRWRLVISHWLHNRELHERARHHARQTEEAWKAKRWAKASNQFFRAALCSPRMTWHRLILPCAYNLELSVVRAILFRSDSTQQFEGKYADGWIGPIFRQEIEVPASASCLVLILQHQPQNLKSHLRISPQLRLNGKQIQKLRITEPKQFAITADITRLRGTKCLIEIRTSEYFIPRFVHSNSDDRKLSILLHQIRFDS